MTTSNMETTFGNTPTFGLHALIRTLKTRIKRHREYHRTIRELSRLTDRELDDIGLHRGMIGR